MLKGKVAVVTGGSRGIGAAIARRLADLGAEVALLYSGNAEGAEAVRLDCQRRSGGRAAAYRCDVADFAATKDTVAQIRKTFGTVHILVNNAGITRDGLIPMMGEENFDRVIAVNLKGAFHMIRHTAGLMIRNREGCIINISSVSGIIGNPGQCNYASAKAGLIGLTKTVAKELAPKGIRCNAIAPGFVATDMTASQEGVISQIPLGRMGTPQDMAEAAAYLAQAGYVTGTVLQVDGGIAI